VPFVFGGITRQSVSTLGYAPLLFTIGIIPLLFGSALWMLPFFAPGISERLSSIYHVWVALGACFALVIYVDMQFAGDPRPAAHVYYAPAGIAFIIALFVSWFHTRLRNRRNA